MMTTFGGMDTIGLDTGETELDRQRRLLWEAERIAAADADIAAGRVVDEADVDGWIDSLGTDRERPVPFAGR